MNTNLSAIELWIENKKHKESILILCPLLNNLQYDGLSNYHIRFILNIALDYCIQQLDGLKTLYIYNKNPEYKTTQKENIFQVIEHIFQVSPKNHKNISTLFMFKIEQAYGDEIFKKYKINCSNTEYLKDKFSYSTTELIQSYHFATNSTKESENIQKYNETLDSITELFNKNKIKLDFLKTKMIDSSLLFCLAIELGYQPSQKEILDSFNKMWESCRTNNLYELNFFCESLSQTNVFINTLAPSKNLQQAIKVFFKDYMIKNNSQNFNFGTLAKTEDKEGIFLNNPIFMYKNMDEKLVRAKALQYLGKSSLSNKEKIILNTLVDAEKTPIKKKLKI